MGSQWLYYEHALIPNCAPHEDPDTSLLDDISNWKESKGKVFLARWTSNFDCKDNTDWWYCIKDTPFEIEKLNSKRRYEVRKGEKNFITKKIDPREYKEDLFAVQKAAFSAYPLSYRPNITRDNFNKDFEDKWSCCAVFGAFDREKGRLAGYALLRKEEKYISFDVQKTDPEYEKMGVNAALVKGILDYYNDDLGAGLYICDGARNIMHETKFQEYLEKYFMFRRAYCHLNLKYKGG